MKLQLDTVNKTITLEEKVKLSELFDLLEKLFPDGKWKDYKLESKQIINWTSPIVIEKSRGWWETPLNPTWVYDPSNTAFSINPYEFQSGTYNFDVR